MAEKEHAIGERFEVDCIIYEAHSAPAFQCQGCSLYIEEENECLDHEMRFGHCAGIYRKDGQDVIFVQVGEEMDLESEQRMRECPYRKIGCTMYENKILECNGACGWVVDYLKLKELKTQKGE